MIVATIYDTSNGVIHSTCRVESIEDVELQLSDGLAYIEGEYSGVDYWLPNGVPTERLDAGLAIPAEVRVGDDLSFTVPDDSYAVIDGQIFIDHVLIDTSQPRIGQIFICGSHKGQYNFEIKGYVENRVAAYPPIGEQLDYIYHNGYEAWYQMITDIKNQYPKPS